MGGDGGDGGDDDNCGMVAGKLLIYFNDYFVVVQDIITK